MNTDLHTRLEEAAKKYEPDAFDADYILPVREGFIVSGKRAAFRAGAEHGYKEAIAQTKEWLKQNAQPKYIYFEDCQPWIDNAKLLADFESDMNKLWEEKK